MSDDPGRGMEEMGEEPYSPTEFHALLAYEQTGFAFVALPNGFDTALGRRRLIATVLAERRRAEGAERERDEARGLLGSVVDGSIDELLDAHKGTGTTPIDGNGCDGPDSLCGWCDEVHKARAFLARGGRGIGGTVGLDGDTRPECPKCKQSVEWDRWKEMYPSLTVQPEAPRREESFEEWHRRACYMVSVEGEMTCGVGDNRWPNGCGAFAGRTCREVYEQERRGAKA